MIMGIYKGEKWVSERILKTRDNRYLREQDAGPEAPQQIEKCKEIRPKAIHKETVNVGLTSRCEKRRR